ncbi:MAG TPA: protein kinase [Vicinamibacterales bacterium]|jgi:serine/threonine protein kinase|nr:protein kinase [Vicinamibacterales bacterium]
MLTIGTRLGPYEIVAPLGAGGMGEVYRARDTKLNRDVALKVLLERFVVDPQRVARFKREARILAALNHPNIGAVYGSEEADDGRQALVLELVEGGTLAERIARGPIRIEEALPIARQIADALDTAHERGIIHRDLKPSNIKLRPDGTVKVLDFGLAKALDPGAGEGETEAAAVTMSLETEPGVLLGTAAYMSPEQARGDAVDKRADIWAFGCVLFELLTGEYAFRRETVSATLAAVLAADPPWAKLPSATPVAIRRLLDRCLEKDAKRRLRDIGDARLEIEDAMRGPKPAPVPHVVKPRGRSVPWVAVAVLAGAGLIAAGLAWPRRGAIPTVERAAQFTLSLAEMPAGNQPIGMLRPSPDGQFFVFAAGDPDGHTSLWIRSLDSLQVKALPGTEGVDGAIIWSPDGRWIGFYADGKLRKVSPAGGPPQTIAELPGFQDAAWGAQGDILFRSTSRAPLLRISESGGPSTQVTELNESLTENSHRGPSFLPDGRRFLFTSRCGQRENNAVYIGSLDSRAVKRLMPAQSQARYVPPADGPLGTLLFYRDGVLMAQPFDADAEELGGNPAPVIDNIAYNATGIGASFSLSADGRVVIVEPTGANDNRFTWFNRNGDVTGLVGLPGGDQRQPRISPNGDRVAFSRPDDQTGNRDIWVTELARGITSRLTVHVANDWFPVWSPDGRQLLFGSDRAGGTAVPPYIKKSMDPGSEESPVPDGADAPYDWSRDGRWISYGSDDILVASASGDRKPFQFLASRFLEGNGRFSPDGKWLAYVSNETGRYEVYVRPFAGTPAGAEGKIQVSNNGGDYPVWGPLGQELFYMSRDFNLYAVSTKNLGPSSTVPLPSRLFQACPGTMLDNPPARGTLFSYAFDTYDGQRFLINCRVQPRGTYRVLINSLMPR